MQFFFFKMKSIILYLACFLAVETRRLIVLEDFFLSYCRFLEEYDQIMNDEEEISKEVKKYVAFKK